MLRIEIHLKGRINPHWSEWFAGLSIEPSGPDETLLRGTIADQAALYGVIARLRDLGLRLVSVRSEQAGGRKRWNERDLPLVPGVSGSAAPH